MYYQLKEKKKTLHTNTLQGLDLFIIRSFSSLFKDMDDGCSSAEILSLQ